ncbi:hypothetical protein SDC9_07755 [bioreactor metagenome]|uniref:Uncharacterized protein n=1 Tax=bioreactor metagenome TaxID=1076179 RepID=A0A644T7F5_9ZZZZ|nr:hypothetical protein [Candidatus Elulimicrobiales bacterium]
METKENKTVYFPPNIEVIDIELNQNILGGSDAPREREKYSPQPKGGKKFKNQK